MPGAGKSTAALAMEQLGFFQFRFGGIVTDEVTRRGLPITPDNERTVREEFRAYDGMAAIAKRALPNLKDALTKWDCIVIDGLYSWSEYKLLQTDLGAELIVVAITCERAIRYARLANRPVRPLTSEEVRTRDWAEIENLEKGGPIAIADYTLTNNGVETDLLAKLDVLLRRLDFMP
jgi:dephospho-CoA kinase